MTLAGSVADVLGDQAEGVPRAVGVIEVNYAMPKLANAHWTVLSSRTRGHRLGWDDEGNKTRVGPAP